MGTSDAVHTPMSACLYVEMADGSTMVFASGKEWKAALNAAPGWQEPKYDDSAWQNATAYVSPKAPMGSDAMGNPWQTRGKVASPTLHY